MSDMEAGAGIGAGLMLAQAAIDGAKAILSRICLPAAQEYGLFLQEKINGWRALQLVEMTKKLDKKLARNKVPKGAHAHPRIAGAIMDRSSYADDDGLQEMWAGLLASSCTENGDDDSNLIFANLLSDLTKLQARVVKYACENAQKWAPHGLIQVNHLSITLDDLCKLTGENDIHRLDRELDHLGAIGILHPKRSGLVPGANLVNLTPTPLALYMYVRCEGSRLNPVEFFKISEPPPSSAPTSVQEPAQHI